MRNVNIVIKPDETPTDIIAQICLEENIRSDDFFAFSAIMTDEGEMKKLKINCVESPQRNPYTPNTLVKYLYQNSNKNMKSNVRYVVPPVEQYLIVYHPSLCKMIEDVYPYYKQLIPNKEYLMSTLQYTIINLHRKGYYIHKKLIFKTFVNELNKEIRKDKNIQNISSLDAEIGLSDDGQSITLLDQLQDPEATQEARRQMYYTEEDYLEDMFEAVKATMLEDMSQLAFDRILIQLQTRTVDRSTSGKLAKYREIFNPGYNPRPGNKGDNHYSRKSKEDK